MSYDVQGKPITRDLLFNVRIYRFPSDTAGTDEH